MTLYRKCRLLIEEGCWSSVTPYGRLVFHAVPGSSSLKAYVLDRSCRVLAGGTCNNRGEVLLEYGNNVRLVEDAVNWTVAQVLFT